MSFGSEDFHLSLGMANFEVPNMKPVDGSIAPTVTCPVIYFADVENFLTGIEIDYFENSMPEGLDSSRLAVQVAVLVGPSGIVYHKIAQDFIRISSDEDPITLKSNSSFVITKRVLPYEETLSETELINGGEPPLPLLRSATCEYNTVADSNIVFNQGANEEWLAPFVSNMKIGGSYLKGIFSNYPEYGNYYFKNALQNRHSAGYNTRDSSYDTCNSHFYKFESSLNAVPYELYRMDYYGGWKWQRYRPELLDEYGAHTHYSLAYEFNQKGSYFRQGMDGNQWYPSNMDASKHSQFVGVLGDGGDGNRTPYTSPASFKEHLSPENFYNVNARRGIWHGSGYTVASPMSGGGINLTGFFDVGSNYSFYRYNIYLQSPIYREFMTGGRLGLFANFSDYFKEFRYYRPAVDSEDNHTTYEGIGEIVETTSSGSECDPSPIPRGTKKSLEYWQRYQLGGGNPMVFALHGIVDFRFDKMLQYPGEGFIPTLNFDIRMSDSAESMVNYPITETDTDGDGLNDETAIEERTEESLLVHKELQNTYVKNLVMVDNELGVSVDPESEILTDFIKSINFFPVSGTEGILNYPTRDSSLTTTSVGSFFGTGSDLKSGAKQFDKFIYWASVDGPVTPPTPEVPVTDPPTPSPPPEPPNKILVCFGSDLVISMVNHAKICNRCYNMVRTTACTASTMPAPLQDQVGNLTNGRDLSSFVLSATFNAGSRFTHFGIAPPEPRNFFLDQHLHSTEGLNEGGYLNQPVITNVTPSADWRTDFWNSHQAFTSPDERHVTALRPWKDTVALGRLSVWSDWGHVRSTIFDFAWNLSIDGVTQGNNFQDMAIPQGSIQTDGFIDMIGNVPVNSLNKRVNELGLIHGGLYMAPNDSFGHITDMSAPAQFSPMGGSSLGGLMGSRGSVGGGVGMWIRVSHAMVKADYCRSVVLASLYNHNSAEIGVALGSGCSNISIYFKRTELSGSWGEIPESIYSYYGYAGSPHYMGLHPKGFIWIPTDIGYYVHDDNDPVSTNYSNEQALEWVHPLLRTGKVVWTHSSTYTSKDDRVNVSTIKTPISWDNDHLYDTDDRMIKFTSIEFIPTTVGSWLAVPKVNASDIYLDSIFTVLGSYGQVTNGDSSYWQYVENYLTRDITSAGDLDALNSGS